MASKVACVLAIGGLDPGGGAGVLADMRAVARAGAFGCAAVAVLTVQSTSGLRRATPVAHGELIAECNEVLGHQRVGAIKTGALGSIANTRRVAQLLAAHGEIPAIVDTVMLPTRGRRGARLLDARAVVAMREDLVPRAALVTANAPEADVLTGLRVTRLDEAHDAARALVALGARAALVKGGHLSGSRAIDVLATKRGIVELAAPRLRDRPLHGGGCVLASLVAGRLAATDATIEQAVRWAKRIHHAAIARAMDVGGELRVLLP